MAVVAGAGHPVWGHDDPSHTARSSWAAAFEHYDPQREPHWGNRIQGDAWLPYALELLGGPADPTRRLDLGMCRGVALIGSVPHAGTVRIEARHNFVKMHTWTAYTAPAGAVTQDGIDTWLADCALHATAIRTTSPTPTGVASAALDRSTAAAHSR